MEVTLFHTVNEGLYLWWRGKGILVDGLHRGGECGFSPVPEPVRRQLVERRGMFAHLDGLLFTHLHTDHFDPLLLEAARSGPKPPALYGPGLAGSVPARPAGAGAHRFDLGPFRVYAVDTVHDGPGLEGEDHQSFFLRAGAERLFLAGDARLDPALAEALAELDPAPPTAAFVNVYQACAPVGQEFLRRLAPERIFLYHLPFPEDDKYLHWTMAEQAVRRFPPDLPPLEPAGQMAWVDQSPPPWAAEAGIRALG